jgi:Cu(I)/Ag(I) efflux system membrane fusion protein
MHPWITSDKPGNCTICGMAMVPVYEGSESREASPDSIKLQSDSISVLGVSTVPVRRMGLTKFLRFSGNLEDDETVHRVVAAFYDGRLEDIYVDHVGQYVQKGQPLAAIYSPELLYAVREYQSAAKSGNSSAAQNSARRLVQYGLTPEQVGRLAKMPADIYTIDLLAPINGTIVMKKAYKGQYLKTGEPLFEMGDLARMWFHAEVYERDLPDIRIGQKASIRTATVPGRDFEGVVTFIDPNFDEMTRSTKVRIVVDNPEADDGGHGLRRLLPHRAYAEAELTADLGEALVVPRSALLRDGRRSLVYVETAGGRYEPRTVRAGRTGNQGVEILEGLKEGERVVAQGNLMLDAEAQLRLDPADPTQPAQPAQALPEQPQAIAFLAQLARVSAALATDDAVAAAKAGETLPALAAEIPESGITAVDAALAALQSIPTAPTGSDLKALRRTFLSWSMSGAQLALALTQAGSPVPVRTFECPMTGDSFPGAPPNARWVQDANETQNPYFGAGMPECGAEVKP